MLQPTSSQRQHRPHPQKGLYEVNNGHEHLNKMGLLEAFKHACAVDVVRLYLITLSLTCMAEFILSSHSFYWCSFLSEDVGLCFCKTAVNILHVLSKCINISYSCWRPSQHQTLAEKFEQLKIPFGHFPSPVYFPLVLCFCYDSHNRVAPLEKCLFQTADRL